jgi:transcriptional regulator with XRE-family HTH domain
MGSLRYSELIEWFVTAELMAIRDERGWSRTRLGAAINKHANTIRGWEKGDRLPDKANVALICRMLQVDAARAAFLEHVTEELNRGPELISDLGKRNLFIVESAERRYGEFITWDPVYMHGLAQKEAYHMNRLDEPLEGAAFKIKNWLRKERRQTDFFGRTDGPSMTLLVPEDAMTDLVHLGDSDRQAQVDRLLEIDARPQCGVYVVPRPYRSTHAFSIFRPGGRPGAGPSFVYVETLDQARHIVEEEKIALYDRFASVMLDDAIRIGRFLNG